MIILEDADGGTKSDRYDGLTLRHPQPARTREGTLPDYHTSEEEYRKTTVGPSAGAHDNIPWIDRRVWRAALYALGIYVFLTLTIAVPITVLRSHKERYIDEWKTERSSRGDTVNLNGYGPGYQVGSLGSLGADLSNGSCNLWDSTALGTNKATARFSLPSNASGYITIRSNATYLQNDMQNIDGTMAVYMNSNVSETAILFTVDMSYTSTSLRERTNVCFPLSYKSRGLAIYIPSHMDATEKLGFNITVLLPQTHTNIDYFATYLPMMTQHFGNLTGTPLGINEFNLQGAARPITCEALTASTITVTNVVADIKGSFYGTTSVTLDTIKGAIISNVTLTSQGGNTSPRLYLVTGDSSIDANVTVDAGSDDSSMSKSRAEPTFNVQANTFNGPLNLDVRYLRPKARPPLTISVQNTLGPVAVSLDKSYSGVFHAVSKSDSVTLLNAPPSPAVYDASSTPMRRTEYSYLDESSAHGWVGWGMKPAASSDLVGIQASLGPITLNFGPT